MELECSRKRKAFDVNTLIEQYPKFSIYTVNKTVKSCRQCTWDRKRLYCLRRLFLKAKRNLHSIDEDRTKRIKFY